MSSVAVIIAVHLPGRDAGQDRMLAEALTSLEHQIRPASEVVVVDDGSPGDLVARVVAHHPGVRLDRQPHAGAAVARNRGVELSTAEALLFLDADDRLTRRALAALQGALFDGSSTADGNGTVDKSDTVDRSDALDCGGTVELVSGITREFIDPTDPPRTARAPRPDTRSVIGGATLVRRTLFDRIGGLDPARRQGEWIDWVHRARTAGAVQAWVPEVVLERRLHARNGTTHVSDADYLAVARAALARSRDARAGTAGG